MKYWRHYSVDASLGFDIPGGSGDETGMETGGENGWIDGEGEEALDVV